MMKPYNLDKIKVAYDADDDSPDGPPVPWYTMILASIIEDQAEQIEILEREIIELQDRIFEIMNPCH